MITVLCGINSKYIHSCLSVYSLYSSCREYEKRYFLSAGDIFVKEYTINDVYDNVLYGIMSHNPDILAFSVYIWNVNFVSRLVSDIKRIKPDCIIVLGGPEVSYGTEDTNLIYDYIIEGEGERAFYSLIASLNNPNFIPDKRWGYVVNGKYVSALPSEDLSEHPFIYNEENIGVFDNRIIYYESSRGCPFSCGYCLSSANKGVRFLPLERVFKDIDFFLEHNVKQVKFVDRTFNCNENRSYEIFRYIIDNTNDTTNFHFEIGADLFSDRIIDLLKHVKPGVIQFEIGIQSTYEKALEASSRKTDLIKTFATVKKLMSYGNINIHVDLIAGLPYETLDIFKKSFNDVYAFKAHQLQLGFLKILKGTSFNNMLYDHDYIFSTHSPYEILSNRYLSYTDIMYLKRIEDVLERLYNSPRFVFTLENLYNLYGDAFEMFGDIACFFEEKGLLFMSLSSRELYNLFFGFLKHSFPEKEDMFKELLLLDYYCSDKSDLPPERLRSIWSPERRNRNRIKLYLEENGLTCTPENTIRYIGDSLYIFDYNKKDPVTGRYYMKTGIENRV